MSTTERSVVSELEDGTKILGCPCGTSTPPETWKELLRVTVRARCPDCGRATVYFAHKLQALEAWNAGEFDPPLN